MRRRLVRLGGLFACLGIGGQPITRDPKANKVRQLASGPDRPQVNTAKARESSQVNSVGERDATARRAAPGIAILKRHAPSISDPKSHHLDGASASQKALGG